MYIHIKKLRCSHREINCFLKRALTDILHVSKIILRVQSERVEILAHLFFFNSINVVLFRHHEFFVRNPLPISHTPTDREPTYWTFLVVVITCFYYPQFTNDIVKLFCFWRSCYENMPLLMDARQRINTIGEISFTEVQRSQSEKSMNYSR